VVGLAYESLASTPNRPYSHLGTLDCFVGQPGYCGPGAGGEGFEPSLVLSGNLRLLSNITQQDPLARGDS